MLLIRFFDFCICVIILQVDVIFIDNCANAASFRPWVLSFDLTFALAFSLTSAEAITEVTLAWTHLSESPLQLRQVVLRNVSESSAMISSKHTPIAMFLLEDRVGLVIFISCGERQIWARSQIWVFTLASPASLTAALAKSSRCAAHCRTSLKRSRLSTIRATRPGSRLARWTQIRHCVDGLASCCSRSSDSLFLQHASLHHLLALFQRSLKDRLLIDPFSYSSS